MVSPDPRHPGRGQADFPLIDLSEFTRPPLQFFGNPASTQTACMYVHCGYGSIRANKFLGAQFGLIVFADQTVNIGSVVVALNSFEENSVQSVYVTQDGPSIASVQIIGNQFSNIAQEGLTGHIVVQPSTGGAGSSITDVDISDNNFYSQLTSAAPGFIFVQATSVTIARNRGSVIGGAAYGVIVEAGAAQVSVLDNQWRAAGGALLGTTGYLIQATAMIRDLSSTAFTVALLPADAQDGSQIYATDGKSTGNTTGNFTVEAGGGGCIANRAAGAWLCF